VILTAQLAACILIHVAKCILFYFFKKKIFFLDNYIMHVARCQQLYFLFFFFFSFFFFVFFLPNILAIPREIQRVRETESETNRE